MTKAAEVFDLPNDKVEYAIEEWLDVLVSIDSAVAATLELKVEEEE